MNISKEAIELAEAWEYTRTPIERIAQAHLDLKKLYEDAIDLKCKFCGKSVNAIRCYDCRYAG